jgi:hypothetical protein
LRIGGIWVLTARSVRVGIDAAARRVVVVVSVAVGVGGPTAIVLLKIIIPRTYTYSILWHGELMVVVAAVVVMIWCLLGMKEYAWVFPSV